MGNAGCLVTPRDPTVEGRPTFGILSPYPGTFISAPQVSCGIVIHIATPANSDPQARACLSQSIIVNTVNEFPRLRYAFNYVTN